VGPVVTGQAVGLPATPETRPRSRTLVWIDAREAVLARWDDGDVTVEHVRSDVPAHVRATGHVRHDPTVRHGGGRTQSTIDSHRIEHLDRFTDDIAARLSPTDDLTIIGSGPVHERLARRVGRDDANHHRSRSVTCASAPRQTDRQLVARLHRLVGEEPRRRSVGAYRWTGPGDGRDTGTPRRWPRRVAPKPHRLEEESP
jgi:hypothetical protein